MILTRNAVLPDVESIRSIIQPYADAGTLLPRTRAEVAENIRDFVVAEENGRIIACGALHLYGLHLAEIRSIAVAPENKSRGAGRALVEALMDEARRHSVTCVCLFTRSPSFFAHLGFEIATRADLPDKIYKDCVCCPKLHDCDEIATFNGKLPPNSNGFRDSQIAIPLVQLKP